MPLDPALAGQLKLAAGIIGPIAAVIGGVTAGLGLVLSIDSGSQIAEHLGGLDYGS